MKYFSLIIGLVLIPALVFATSQNDKITFKVDVSNSTMTIEGGSTVGSWDAAVTMIDAEFGINIDALKAGNEYPENLFELGKFVVPVEKIDGDGRRLNRNIHSYLKKDDHPNIYFTLSSANILDGDTETGIYTVEVEGVINAAGKDHDVTFETQTELNGDGSITISGVKDLLFSDFDIDRPSAMLGTVRADEELAVRYNLVLVRK